MVNKKDVDSFLLDITIDKLKSKNTFLEIKNSFLKYFPEFIDGFDVKQENKYHIYTVGEHTLYTIANSKRSLLVRWTLALHDIGKPIVKSYDEKGTAHFYLHHLKSVDIASEILSRYKFDENEKIIILSLIKNHDRDIKSKSAIRRLLREMTEEEIYLLLEVKYGDAKGQNTLYIEKRIADIQLIRIKLEEIIEENKRFKISDLSITGKDLIEIGITNGKDIGYILNSLVELVLEDKILNTKKELVETALQIWKNNQ